MDLKSSKLGKTPDEKNKKISEVILKLSEIDFKLEDTERDILGDAYEYEEEHKKIIKELKDRRLRK